MGTCPCSNAPKLRGSNSRSGVCVAIPDLRGAQEILSGPWGAQYPCFPPNRSLVRKSVTTQSPATSCSYTGRVAPKRPGFWDLLQLGDRKGAQNRCFPSILRGTMISSVRLGVGTGQVLGSKMSSGLRPDGFGSRGGLPARDQWTSRLLKWRGLGHPLQGEANCGGQRCRK